MTFNPPPDRQGKRKLAAALAAAVVLVLAVVGAVLIFHNSEKPDSPTASSDARTRPTTTARAPQPTTTTAAPVRPKVYPPLPPPTPKPSTVDCTYTATRSPGAKPVNPPPAQDIPTSGDNSTTELTMQTNRGDLGLTLNNSVAPCTTNSFVSLAQQGYFDETNCHRLTASDSLRVLQCGDPSGTGTGSPGYEFDNEYPTDAYAPGDPAQRDPVQYNRGLIAMANAGPGTNGSQFFLVYGDSLLPPQYTVFGTIDENGLAVLDAIAASGVARSRSAGDGPPATPVEITSVQLN